WEMIDRETEEAVKSEGFAKIERSLLEAVVKRDSLTIREVELFKAVDVWASKECERQGLTLDSNVKRKILGERIVKEIRFPVMEKEEFSDVVPNSGILTSQEVAKMMMHFDATTTLPVGFHGNKRDGACQSCLRFGLLVKSIGCTYMEENKCVNVKFEKDVTLHGIRLSGSENGSYTVTLTVEDDDELVVEKAGNFSSTLLHSRECSFHGFDVMFDPVDLSDNVDYKFKVSLNGPLPCHERIDTSAVGSNCLFGDCEGFHECGQIVDIFYKLS
ncbi:hypothetical protein ACROYT_G035839, partial [Oculina patagonica]